MTTQNIKAIKVLSIIATVGKQEETQHKKTHTQTNFLPLWDPVYNISVLRFRPKKQQFSVALPTP